jgi:hypothetical protein
MAGMVLYEREIMDLWDDGVGKREIVARTGLARGTVDTIVSRYDTANLPADDRQFASAMRFASAQLLSAIQRERR